VEAGLSLSALAREAHVSRRYLTEAEAGRANPSALVLLRLSEVLRIEPGRLLERGPAARRSSERVALVGLRGAGKTSVGRLLARALEVPFVELDRRVEEVAGLSLAEIFDLQGAAAFHRFEREALERVLAEGDRSVIASGGSIVDDEPGFARLLETCRTVWLRASAQEHMRRVLAQGDRRPVRDRPRAMEELRALLGARGERFARRELGLPTDGRAPEELAREIARWLGE
jgi:XRE family aerobic/anaerobic benzoate catabolism transcriptional regulator